MKCSVRLLSALIPPVFLGAYALTKAVDREFARLLIYESGWFEWFQFWCFLGASIASGFAAYRLLCKQSYRMALFVGCLASSLLFIALEEINWGQWILDIPLPAYFEKHNSQKNLTLHNLDFIQPHLHLFTIIGCTVTSLAIVAAPSMRVFSNIRELLPDRVIALYVAPLAIFYLFTDYLSPYLVAAGWEELRVGFDHRKTLIIFSDQEALECILALGVLLYTLTLVRTLAAKCGTDNRES